MHASDIQRLAERFKRGELTVDDFVGALAQRPTADLGEVQLDLDRRRRCGFPEVIFGQGKTLESLSKAFHALIADGVDVLATRISAEHGAALCREFAAGRYNPLGRTFRIPQPSPNGEPHSASGHVAIVTAGTSDLPVAEEARETALWMGHRVTLIQDVGVAGPHRLPARLPEFADADAVVVIAGMEGALPSVVGGYVDCPVIGVPTSVGYGANFNGVAALLSMLNSCAANVTVVNIDAGFKGAYVAGLIAARRSEVGNRKS
ncbi:MAG TPA: nickel pincer cofactor biosynthesis protein LarB [Pirellulales bacterium]|nr:nickel pincer cofactor biosynthesis protein LarB [Pirellulales bacterium]